MWHTESESVLHRHSTPVKQVRVTVSGKFLMAGSRRFQVKGVTYGTFAPDASGIQFPPPDRVLSDFQQMAENGINCVRTYTVPPLYLLESAWKTGLRVMVGLPWTQHITFLDSPEKKSEILSGVRNDILRCRQHPAIMCYTLGNEIPAPIVRWYGRKKIAGFLHELYKIAKAADPEALVTYVNYPTTEYLELPFLDFFCFNVYLETKEKLRGYLLRLQNICGDKPLVLAEIGLDSRRNGVEKQAETIKWQVETVFSTGCAGSFVFAWTDEWWRGGFSIEDWDFGLVDRAGQPKPALHQLKSIYDKKYQDGESTELSVSVVVCSYNGGATIRDTLDGLLRLSYSNYEVIVVDDGSSDDTAAIASRYPFRLISQKNKGLSAARNAGIEAAHGEIVAFIDDDAYPDPDWLHFLSLAFRTTGHAGIGGPNIAPQGAKKIANCVALAPGGPVHVLLSDEIAEHIPGCNMAFRRDALLEIGGFDPVFRSAGDDVDLCWRIQYTGRTIGFHPSAFVWHHRRNSIKAYWKQQKGYGKAEALLENKWPEKYNGFGHLSWAGKIYGHGLTHPLPWSKSKVFHGTWGSAPFQSVYGPAPNAWASLPIMPEWFLLVGFLMFLSCLSFFWPPLRLCIPVMVFTLGLVFAHSIWNAQRALKHSVLVPKDRYASYLLLTSFLHTIQPIARLIGRIRFGLTPWRRRGNGKLILSRNFPFRKTLLHWSERWKSSEEWLGTLEKTLLKAKSRVRRGGSFDQWDLMIGSGLFTSTRSLLTIEEHGSNKQYLKLKAWMHVVPAGIICIMVLFVLAIFAWFDQYHGAAIILAATSVIMLTGCVINGARSMNDMKQAFLMLSEETGLASAPAEHTILPIENEDPEHPLKRILIPGRKNTFGQNARSNVESRVLEHTQHIVASEVP